MNLMKRILMLVLTLAALAGISAHETAASQMSIQMSLSSAMESGTSDSGCPACEIEAAAEASACDMDCTTSAFGSVAGQVLVPAWKFSAQHLRFVDLRRAGRPSDFEPMPPRDIILV